MPRSTFMRSSPVPYSEVEGCVSCQLLRPQALGAPVDFGLPGLFRAWARALVGGMGQDRLFDPNVVPHGAREEVLAYLVHDRDVPVAVEADDVHSLPAPDPVGGDAHLPFHQILG